MNAADTIGIREVGPRDGLQAESPLPVEDRIRLIEALAASGLAQIEATAFVSPAVVPSMANPVAVLNGVARLRGVEWWALVPNVRGAKLAVEAGVDFLTVTVSACEVYNLRNVRMTIDESVAALAGIRSCAGSRAIDAVISCAFGSPYSGDILPTTVAELADRLLESGATSITMADTTGMATPRRVLDLLQEVGPSIGLHLHETRGTALVNAYAALGAGVRRFDTSIGGLGGSPFAAGAAGNLATEDLVHLCDDLGIASGVSLEKLLEASTLAADLVQHPVPSRIAAAGPRSRRAE